jgi:hypothetical protein
MTTPAPTVPGRKLDPPKRGTTRIIYSTDASMMSAVNHAVDAIRELQTIVAELIDEVRELQDNR